MFYTDYKYSKIFGQGQVEYYNLKGDELSELILNALKGDYYSAARITMYFGMSKFDYHNSHFWMYIGFENNPNQTESIASVKDIFNTLIMRLNSDSDTTYARKMERSFYFFNMARKNGATWCKYSINRYKNIDEWEHLSDDEKYMSAKITEENLDAYIRGALLGSGIAALRLAKKYEADGNVNEYIECLSFMGAEFDENEFYIPAYWYRIGAQNGNKECMKEYAILLYNSSNVYDNIRADFWKARSAD